MLELADRHALDNILIFVKVAQFESITRAARSLHSDLDGESSIVGPGIRARCVASEAHHALGTIVYCLVAAPEYLRARTFPAEPIDLRAHDCVMFNAKNNERDCELVSGRRKVRVHVAGPAASRDISSASAFVYRGHGIGLAPSTLCDEAIAKGKLIRLLPKWISAPIPVFALYSSRKFLPSRLSVFLEALTAWKSPLWIRE